MEMELGEAKLTKAQQAGLKKLGRAPIGFHFADSRSERQVFSALVRLGLAAESWGFGDHMWTLTDAGRAALKATPGE